VTASQDINFAAQANLLHSSAGGISLFTYGKANAKEKPNQETGLHLHAASGKYSSQSQEAATKLTADKAVTVASVQAEVNVAAKQHVLLTTQGAAIRIEGGDITLNAPGKIEFKASMKELGGPASGEAELPKFSRQDMKFAQRFQLLDTDGLPLKEEPYTIYVADQQEIRGKTNAQGMTSLVDTEHSEATYIIFDRDLQWVCEEDSDDEDHTHC